MDLTRLCSAEQLLAEQGIKYKNAEDGEQIMKSDIYVTAIGQSSNRGTLKEELDDMGIPCRYIGDAYEVGKVLNAIRAGYYAGKDI